MICFCLNDAYNILLSKRWHSAPSGHYLLSGVPMKGDFRQSFEYDEPCNFEFLINILIPSLFPDTRGESQSAPPFS